MLTQNIHNMLRHGVVIKKYGFKILIIIVIVGSKLLL